MKMATNSVPPTNKVISFAQNPVWKTASALIIFLCAFGSLHAQQFITVGNASYYQGNCHFLNPGLYNVAGAVWHVNKIDLNYDAHFEGTVYLGVHDANGGDGAAFVMQPVSNGALGGVDGGLGYFGISPSLAVEFDTYENSSSNDPADDHIALMKNGVVDHSAPENLVGPIALSNLENAQNHPFVIDWNAATQNLKVTFKGVLQIDYTDDIVANIFNGDNNVFWGFTSSTGAAIQNVQVVCMFPTLTSYTEAPALTWTNSGGNSNWSTGSNWTGGQPPATNDEVVFNAATSSDVNIDVNVDIKGLTTSPDYNGVVKLNAQTLALQKSMKIKNASSFNKGTGKVIFKGSVKADSKAPLNDLEIDTPNGDTITLESDLTVDNNLVIKSEVGLVSSQNKLKVKGNVDIQKPMKPWTNGFISMFTSTLQNFKSKGSAMVEVNKDGGQVTLTANSEVKELKVKKGLIAMGTKNLSGPNNTQAQVNIECLGKIKGRGYMFAYLRARKCARLAPGSSPGTLTIEGTLELEPEAILEYETTPTEHDLVVVIGNVIIGGSILEISATGTPPGILEIIENDDIDPIVGTFEGLPEGSPVAIDGKTYFISYVGGTGNDVVLSQCPPAGTLYVNASAAGNNDGTSWTDAFPDLQDALSLANTCSNITEIWVAAGTYKPTSGTDRTISFVMKNNLAIYGGFDGTETLLSQRDWVANVTTLNGDIGTQGDDADNSIHVIFNDNNGLNSSAMLDGFTITKGNANDSTSPYGQSGGGMMNATSSPAISNCIFIGNTGDVTGGGMGNQNSNPTITSCTFDGNFTASFGGGGGGGGIYNDNSSPTIKNCSFTDNNSGFSQGGGIHNVNGSSSQIVNCLFLNNSSLLFGGGVFNDGSSPTITNCSSG